MVGLASFSKGLESHWEGLGLKLNVVSTLL